MIQQPDPLLEDEYQHVLLRIQSLKLPNLKAVARTLSIAQSGRKADVQDRVRRYLQIGRDSGDRARVYAIKQIVQEAATDPTMITPYETLYRHLPGSQVNRTTSNASSAGSSQSSQSAIKKPWIFFKNNPFFVPKKLVTQTAGYCLKAPDRRGQCRLTFTLTEEDYHKLATTKSYKLFLLCGPYDKFKSNNDVNVEFPHPLEIHFNDVQIKDNVKGIKNKPGTAKPANLTPYIKPAGSLNELRMVYAFTKVDYLIFCYIVEEVSPDRLLQKILSNPHITKDVTMKDFSQDEQDEDDIQEMSTRLSLKCPLSFTRMKYPFKSIYCNHLACFDGLSYIYLQEQASTWQCPVCYKPVQVKELSVSDYVLDILKQTPEDIEQVEIGLDGTWKPVIEDDERPQVKKPKSETPAATPLDDIPTGTKSKTPSSPIIISLDSDDDEEVEAIDPPIPTQSTQKTQPSTNQQNYESPTHQPVSVIEPVVEPQIQRRSGPTGDSPAQQHPQHQNIHPRQQPTPHRHSLPHPDQHGFYMQPEQTQNPQFRNEHDTYPHLNSRSFDHDVCVPMQSRSQDHYPQVPIPNPVFYTQAQEIPRPTAPIPQFAVLQLPTATAHPPHQAHQSYQPVNHQSSPHQLPSPQVTSTSGSTPIIPPSHSPEEPGISLPPEPVDSFAADELSPYINNKWGTEQRQDNGTASPLPSAARPDTVRPETTSALGDSSGKSLSPVYAVSNESSIRQARADISRGQIQGHIAESTSTKKSVETEPQQRLPSASTQFLQPMVVSEDQSTNHSALNPRPSYDILNFYNPTTFSQEKNELDRLKRLINGDDSSAIDDVERSAQNDRHTVEAPESATNIPAPPPHTVTGAAPSSFLSPGGSNKQLYGLNGQGKSSSSTASVTSAQTLLKQNLETYKQRNLGRSNTVQLPVYRGNEDAMSHVRGLQESLQRSISTSGSSHSAPELSRNATHSSRPPVLPPTSHSSLFSQQPSFPASRNPDPNDSSNSGSPKLPTTSLFNSSALSSGNVTKVLKSKEQQLRQSPVPLTSTRVSPLKAPPPLPKHSSPPKSRNGPHIPTWSSNSLLNPNTAPAAAAPQPSKNILGIAANPSSLLKSVSNVPIITPIAAPGDARKRPPSTDNSIHASKKQAQGIRSSDDINDDIPLSQLRASITDKDDTPLSHLGNYGSKR